MKITNGLILFDKNGNPIPYRIENDVLITNLYLPRTSINLWYENTIFIAEKYVTTSDDVWYGSPFTFNQDELLNVNTTNPFFLINPSVILNENPQLSVSNELSYHINNKNLNYSNIHNCYINDDIDNSLIRIDYCFQSVDGEEVIERTIEITDNDFTISVNLYIEVEIEDERYPMMLDNYGMSLDNDVGFIFRQADVNEDLSDFILLNKKRKELFLEHNNIKPYGSLNRSLFNYLKFFGYYDIKVKSLYENKETLKKFYQDVEIDYEDLDRNIRNIRYPNIHTGYISLFYDILRETGELDDFSVPTTEKVFQFTTQEVIVKLNGLKNFFENKNIIGDTKILDIVGQYDYFNRYDINTWSSENNSIVVDSGQTAIIHIEDKEVYIQDVRSLFDKNDCSLDRGVTPENSPDLIFNDYPTCWVGYFNYYNEDEPIYENEPSVLIGGVIRLRNDTFDDRWLQIGTTWNETANSNILITWNNIASAYYYYIQWRIIGNGFNETISGNLSEYNDVFFVVPKTGIYDVEMTIYGFNGEIIIGGIYHQINVLSYEVELSTMFKIYDYPLQQWSTNYLTWESLENEWNNPIYDNDDIIVSEIVNPISDYNLSNYLQIDVDDPRVGINNFISWNEIGDINWNNAAYITWDMLNYRINKLPNFRINDVINGGKLQIGDGVFVLNDYNIEEFLLLSDDLDEEIDDDFIRYDYTARPIDRPTYIDVIGSNMGVDASPYISSKIIEIDGIKNPTWNDFDDIIGVIPNHWDNLDYYKKVESYDSPLDSDGTVISYDGVIIPQMVMVYFSPYKSRIPSITECNWKLMKDGKTVTIISNIYFSYFFIETGNYDIELIIIDSNGNRSVKYYKNQVIVLNSNNYKSLNG